MNPIGTQPTSEQSIANESENQRLGYLATIQLITYEGQLAWSAVTAFSPLLILLLAGAVLERLPFIVSPRGITAVNILCSLVGLAASLVWLSASARSRRIHKYWLANARELEQKLTSVVTLTRGKLLTDGESVDAGGELHKLRGYESLSHTKCFSVLYMFCSSLFAIILLIHVFRLGQQST